MDVRLSSEQEALRDTVAQVVDRLGPRAVAQIGDPDRSRKLHGAVTDSGWRELRAPTDDGRPLASGVEAALVAEQLGRGVADTAFVGPSLAQELRRLAGAPMPRSVETVALNDRLSAVAIAIDGTVARAVAVDGQGSSTAVLLEAREDDYRLVQLALVPGGPATGPDLTRPSMQLDPSAKFMKVEGADRPISAHDVARWTAFGLALACADLVGAMRGSVQLACEYSGQRRQYGAAIGSFQAVQHMLADAHVLMEGSRSIALHAAWAVDALPAWDALAAAAAAKAYCARAARVVGETAIQVHGGIGHTWECMAHVYLRRALLSIDLLGDEHLCLTRVLAHRGIGDGHGIR